MNKEILESLTMLEDKLNLKNVKNDLFLTEAKNKPNDMDGDQLDYNEKKLYQKRADYDKKVKEFNDQSIEVERLKQVSQVNKDPAIEQNYERKKTALKTLKSEKSQAYWDKVNAGRDLKNIKYESYEFDQLDESRLPSDPDRDPEFGVPEQKKYPLFDRKHVISAIKLFGHVEPKYESHLAHSIIKRMKKYNISFDIVGEDNKLYKYLPKTVINESVKFDISKFDTSEKILKAIDEYKLKKENLLNDGKDHPSCVYESLDNIIKQLEMKLDGMKINIDESFSNTLIEDIYDNQDGIFSLIESPSFEDADKWKVALYVVKFLTDSALDNILATHNVKQEDINKLKRKEKISRVTNIMNNFPGEIKNKIIYDENFDKYYISY